MSEEQGQTVETPPTEIEVLPKKKKVFSRSNVVRHVLCQVELPELYPDFEPWSFKLRLKLSQDADERRQEYMALAPTDRLVKERDQNLDELCDLMLAAPKGFDDLSDNGSGPGDSFKEYVNTSDEATKNMLLNIVEGAITLYWRKLSPREFRP